MRLPRPLVKGEFLRRDNRFRVTVLIHGKPEAAHLPNSGRLGELLVPGRQVFLAPVFSPRRKTPFDLKLVRVGGTLVSVDARLPGPLLLEAIAGGRLPEFRGYTSLKSEAVYGRSRLDLLLEGPEGPCFIEAKSVTLVENGVALFPDAPTKRGRRHLEELRRIKESGRRAAIVFVVQRSDAFAFAPNAKADPAFARELLQASRAGVEVLAYLCRVDEDSIEIWRPLPIRLF